MAALGLLWLGISAKYILVECQNKCEDTIAEIRATTPNGPSNVNEGSTIELKCKMNKTTVSWDKVTAYLSKDGVGIQMKTPNKDGEHVFVLNEVKKQDSGMYSCVYSECKLPPSQVKSTGDYLRIQVNGDEDGKEQLTQA
ncbi:hypothetical protein DPEC_G00346090, partial [Dallia pectoralis]